MLTTHPGLLTRHSRLWPNTEDHMISFQAHWRWRKNREERLWYLPFMTLASQMEFGLMTHQRLCWGPCKSKRVTSRPAHLDGGQSVGLKSHSQLESHKTGLRVQYVPLPAAGRSLTGKQLETARPHNYDMSVLGDRPKPKCHSSAWSCCCNKSRN